MASIHAFALKDQVPEQKKRDGTRRRTRSKHVLSVLPHYATHAGAPTLAQAQEAAAGFFARLLVAWVAEHGQGVQE